MNKYLAMAAAVTLASPAFGQGSRQMVLTNPEAANGFETRGECEAAIAGSMSRGRKDVGTRPIRAQDRYGSRFNQARGNLSRCENSAGEFLILVYPANFPG